jgi:nucleoside phosphorylase
MRTSMKPEVFRTGTFKGVSVTDAFALAASQQSPVIVSLGAIDWPSTLKPTPQPLGKYSAGEKITTALDVQADVLIILYTEDETSALLDVFTGNNAWTPARKKQWNGYGHNFNQFKPIIEGIDGDTALEDGLFGYLSAVKIGATNVVLFKSELHPKQNGVKLPFVPVIQQLVTELKPSLVLSTGTAGAIGSHVQCGDVVITTAARFHVQDTYPTFPQINALSTGDGQLTNTVALKTTYLNYAAANLTQLSIPGLTSCYERLQSHSGFSFVQKPVAPPAIYVTGSHPVPGPQPMDIVSADFLTVDDSTDLEGLQALGAMNDTDDAFAFFAIAQMSGAKPAWVSVRNASEPQIVAPAGSSQDTIKSLAGNIYGIYQYCTTLNSAFACWAIVAGL